MWTVEKFVVLFISFLDNKNVRILRSREFKESNVRAPTNRVGIN